MCGAPRGDRPGRVHGLGELRVPGARSVRARRRRDRGGDRSGRGESAYNRALGDPNHKVHPCLGPIDEAPYYACEVVPGDIGTCGGLVTDEHARVLDQQDQPIEGLYATGNNTATVMGRHYLGPGASIANTMVFGYLAARHATGRAS